MNKFDEKAISAANADASIIELSSSKYMKESTAWLNAFFDNLYLLYHSLSDLTKQEHAYLASTESKHTLIKVSKQLDVETINVTEIVNKSRKPKTFIYNNRVYKVHRIIN